MKTDGSIRPNAVAIVIAGPIAKEWDGRMRRTCGGMADTVDLGSTAKAWGFESLQVQARRE